MVNNKATGNAIYIMQGRLSSQVPGHLQEFPWQTWELEFERAAAIGFHGLEWLFEEKRYTSNPIWYQAGRERIQWLAERYHVHIQSVCAHFFAQRGLVGDPEFSSKSAGLLHTLIQACGALEIPNLVVPLLEASSLLTGNRGRETMTVLKSCLAAAGEHKVRLLLETDLPAPACAGLIQDLGEQSVGLCYDTGNAISLGFDVVADLELLHPWLAEVHIKDRLRSGERTQPGQGDTPFASIFSFLVEKSYRGPFVLETPPGDDWERNARLNINFVRTQLDRAMGNLALTR